MATAPPIDTDPDVDVLAAVVLPDAAEAALAQVTAGVNGLLEADLVALSDEQVLALTGRLEAQTRRLPAIDHRLIAELDDRKLAARVFQRSTATLLRQLLRLSPRAAKARVSAAADLGPRRALTGQVLAPLFKQVAAAQSAGAISLEHARIVTTTIDKLPHLVEAEHGQAVQASLVEQAHTLDPAQLAIVARRLLAYLDPDGTLADDADQRRWRELTLTRNHDGSYALRGRLTPECGAKWMPVFDTLARPHPAEDDTPDPRKPAQRMHDAFADIPGHLERAKALPACGGVDTTLIMVATLDQLAHRDGFAVTSHGDLIPIGTAIDLAGDAHTISVVFDPHGGIHDYGRTRRVVAGDMRYAIIARDRGCTIPGCDTPPAWCQAHHFREFSAGGPTSLDNCGLLCGYHHREHARQGWTGQLINGVPHWTKPHWLDPTQTPHRNTIHDPTPGIP